MRFCGHEGGASVFRRKLAWHEMYAAKHTKKYSKDDKETVCSHHLTYAF